MRTLLFGHSSNTLLLSPIGGSHQREYTFINSVLEFASLNIQFPWSLIKMKLDFAGLEKDLLAMIVRCLAYR